MATTNAQAAKPMEFRQRRPRPTANPVVSNKPDIYLEFNTSKLGIRVRGGDNKQGLYVAAVTNEAPPQAKDKIIEGAQIISVNEHNLENAPFDQAVEHFAQLTLPIQVRFRPPLYPPRKQSSYQSSHSHHDHDHDHHHHHDDDDDEEEGTCYIACYMILFVISFMIIVSMSLNGFPGIPTQLPSMPRLFPDKSRSGRSRRGRSRSSSSSSSSGESKKSKASDILQQGAKIKEQLRMKSNGIPNDNGGDKKGRRLLADVVSSDMNNIHNILNDVEMNLYDDIGVDELLNMDKKNTKKNKRKGRK
mmetsp:Transcript_32150/g.28211  ORF Transcript_32150/g.28211 Transcript_32150/m.28211 type:complete len:303 (+) Transcript_32150:33-941(+)